MMIRSRLYRRLILGLILSAAYPAVAAEVSPVSYGPSFREDRNGWIFLHISGQPQQRGFQHGYLLAPEIDDFITALRVYLEVNTGKSWDWYRNAAYTILARKVESEYQQEIIGIASGVQARGYDYDAVDILTLNGFVELSEYYLPSLGEAGSGNRWGRRIVPQMRCSAFIATGVQTAGGEIVMAHNSWDDYLIGLRNNVILDIHPSRGYRLLFQTGPGMIHSGTDFLINSSGIVICETTIGNYLGYDTSGVPEFSRIRKAAQYAGSLNDFSSIMQNGNNGGYANTWLVGDIKTNEIGRLELGLLNVSFSTSRTGYFDGENYVDNSKMIREECGPTLWETSGNWPNQLSNANCVTARRLRWTALMDEYQGQVDAELGMQFMADQFEQALGIVNPGGFVLMARMEISDIPEIPGAAAPRPFGASEAKVVTAELARNMSFWARLGHPDGSTFEWGTFLAEHPEFAWQAPYLPDVEEHPWTLFQSSPQEKVD